MTVRRQLCDRSYSRLPTLARMAPGHGYKTPRRGSDPSRSQEGGPGVRPPFKAPEGDFNTPSAPEKGSAAQKSSSPAPARRSRKRRAGALFQDEKRRLLRIEPDLLIHETEVEGIVTALPPSLAAPLAIWSDKVTAPALILALSDEGGEVQETRPEPSAAAARTCRQCKRPTRGHPGPTSLHKCTVYLPSPKHLRDTSIGDFPSPPTAREKREESVPASPRIRTSS